MLLASIEDDVAPNQWPCELARILLILHVEFVLSFFVLHVFIHFVKIGGEGAPALWMGMMPDEDVAYVGR